MQRQSVRRLGTAIAAAALAAGLLAWLARPGPAASGTPVASASARAQVPPPHRAAASQAGAPAAHLPAAAPAPATAPTTQPAFASDTPLRLQVAALLATHDPQDAFRAYELVADCAGFNAQHDLLVYDEEEFKRWKGDTLPGYRGMNEREKARETRVCSGMTERERTARMDYLALAVDAGVPGAAVAFAQEGPFGDPSALKTRPDDPLVASWKAAVNARLTQAAEAGDLRTLNYWGGQNYSGSDLTPANPALAYRYLLAIGLIEADQYGPGNQIAKLYAADSDVANAFADTLTPAQRSAELAAAHRIADTAKARRKRAATPAS